MIRFWEIERREEINITHKSLLRWNAVTSFYCFPLLSSYRQTRRNGDFQKHQYLDYQKINPLDVVKHNVWVPRSIHSYHKIVSNLIIKWLTYLTPYFRASNFLYDFSRSSSITKFEVRRNRDTQTSIFWLSNDYPYIAKRDAWVPEAFTLSQKTINTLIIG